MPIPMSVTQIAEDLIERIYGGEYPQGEKLPSYRELGDIYSVSFSSIAKVMWILKDRGLTIGVAGVGVYVVDDLPKRVRRPAR